jgi:nucleotide-binding universal stress UspA family protein
MARRVTGEILCTMTPPSKKSGRGPCVAVGYDGSEEARAAVSYAAKRAGPEGRVIVVHAFGPPPDWLGAPNYQHVLDDHRGHGKALLDALVLEGGDDLIETDYSLELIGGHPGEALVNAAAAEDADEIVLGSRGFGRVRAALGSVSQDVLRHADRPVVVIPHDAVHKPGDASK